MTGLSVALHAKQLGVGRIVLLERHYIGSGQSGHAAGISRALVAHRALALMLMESQGFFDRLGERYGEKLPIHRLGYLIRHKASRSDLLDRAIRESKEGGCVAHRVSRTEAHELQPGLQTEDDDIFAFEPGAFYMDPMLMTHIYARIVRQMGVEAVEGCPVQSILKEGSQVLGVETAQGKIESNNVLVGTSVWGAAQLASAGIEVPVYRHRAEMAFLAVWPESPLRLKRLLSDAPTGLYLRPEGDTLMFVGWREGDLVSDVNDFVALDPDNYWQTADPLSLEKMQCRLSTVLPFVADGFVHRSYVCVYDYTPDGMPILDRAESLQGLYFALGFSGGGFAISPWVGAVMARFIAEGVKSPEMHLLRLKRFEESQLLTWSN